MGTNSSGKPMLPLGLADQWKTSYWSPLRAGTKERRLPSNSKERMVPRQVAHRKGESQRNTLASVGWTNGKPAGRGAQVI